MYRFRFICVLLLFCVGKATFAQKQGKARVDSLLEEYNSPRFQKMPDTSKVKLINNISFAIHYFDPIEGLKYGHQAKALAEKIKWKKGLGLVYNSLYASHSSLSVYDSAIEYCFKSLNIFRDLGNIRNVATNYGNIAECYSNTGDYPSALKFEFLQLNIADSLKDRDMLGISYMNIGSTYMQLQKFDKAINYFLVAEPIITSMNDQRVLAQCYINLAGCYRNLEKNQVALKYGKMGLAIFNVLEEKIGLQDAYSTLASIYKELNDHELNLEYEFKALELANSIGYKQGIMVASLNIGLSALQFAYDSSGIPIPTKYLPSGRIALATQAVRYLTQCAEIAKEQTEWHNLTRTYEYLHSAYRILGKTDDAFNSLYDASIAHDSEMKADRQLRIAAMETEREKVLKEKQIQINELLEKKKKNERNVFLGTMFLLTAIIIAVVRVYLRIRKQKRKIEKLAEKKDLLLKEIHHRVKNNLQVISSLLDLQIYDTSDENSKSALAESAARVRSISIIHQQLYQNDNIDTIDFARFCKDLVFQLSSTFSSNKQVIDLITNGVTDHWHIDIDTAIPLGLILNELVTNSFKYAFRNAETAAITIHFSSTESTFSLSYNDGGPGLPDGFEITKAKTLGMTLLTSLSRQIGGSFQFDRTTRSFFITFSNQTKRKMID
ncbi:MAG: tetratricopeptide repeat protein [Chitinophagaceae bacterium]|nr:tetratricopeptide repeat protein [Chitinophagaceae bacterium]